MTNVVARIQRILSNVQIAMLTKFEIYVPCFKIIRYSYTSEDSDSTIFDILHNNVVSLYCYQCYMLKCILLWLITYIIAYTKQSNTHTYHPQCFILNRSFHCITRSELYFDPCICIFLSPLLFFFIFSATTISNRSPCSVDLSCDFSDTRT